MPTNIQVLLPLLSKEYTSGNYSDTRIIRLAPENIEFVFNFKAHLLLIVRIRVVEGVAV